MTQYLFPRLTGTYEKVMLIAEAPPTTAKIQLSVPASGAGHAAIDEVFAFRGVGSDGGDFIAQPPAPLFHFDFDDDYDDGYSTHFPYMTAPGHTSVLPTTLYDPCVGYGFVAAGTLVGGSQGTSISWDPVYRDAINVRTSGDYFRVDVPVGEYYVTVAAGQPGYSRWVKVKINGQEYHWASNPAAPPYDVEPADGSIKVIDAIGTENAIKAIGVGDPGRAGSADFFLVQGWNGTYPKVDIEPMGPDPDHRWLAMVKIEQSEPATCADIRNLNLTNPADFNQDCRVDLQDLAILISQWLFCNDPQLPECTSTW